MHSMDCFSCKHGWRSELGLSAMAAMLGQSTAASERLEAIKTEVKEAWPELAHHVDENSNLFSQTKDEELKDVVQGLELASKGKSSHNPPHLCKTQHHINCINKPPVRNLFAKKKARTPTCAVFDPIAIICVYINVHILVEVTRHTSHCIILHRAAPATHINTKIDARRGTCIHTSLHVHTCLQA